MKKKEQNSLEDMLKGRVRKDKELFPLDDSYFGNFREKLEERMQEKPSRKPLLRHLTWALPLAAAFALLLVVSIRSNDNSGEAVNNIETAIPSDIFPEETTAVAGLNDMVLSDNKSVETIISSENISIDIILASEKTNPLLEGISGDEIEDYLIENNLLTEL